MKRDFAIRLWNLTRRGTRVIVTYDDARPVEITSPHNFQPKPKVAAGSSPESEGTNSVRRDIVAAAATYGQSDVEKKNPPETPEALSEKLDTWGAGGIQIGGRPEEA